MKTTTETKSVPARIQSMKSFISVGTGILLSLGVGVLTIFGIIWPLFMTFFDSDAITSTVLGYALMVFAVAFAFYWGGMIAGYKAPFAHRLHGIVVAPAAFVISPTLNFAAGNGFFPGLESGVAAMVMVAVLILSAAAAYVGARRGEALQAYNRDYLRKRELRREHQRRESQRRQSQEG